MGDVGVYTLKQMRDQALRFIQDDSSTVSTLIDEETNDEYMRLAQKKDWQELRGIHIGDINWTVSNARFYCPRDVMTPLALFDNTNNRFVDRMNIQTILYMNPATFDAQGSVMRWAAVKDEGRERNFSSTAEKVKIVSSASGDTSVNVRIAYLDSNDVRLTEQITTDASNGTTEVDSAATLSDLIRVSCGDARTGVITVTGVTSGDVYARLGPSETTVIYKVLYFTQIPSSANAGILIYKKNISKLVNDDDIPELPVSHYLRRHAMAFGLEFESRTAEAQVHSQRANEILQDVMDNSKQGEGMVHRAKPVPRPRRGIKNIGGWLRHF